MTKVNVEAINEQLEKQNLAELHKIRDKLRVLIIAKEEGIIKGNVSPKIFNQEVDKNQKEVKNQDAKTKSNSDTR